MSSKDAYRDKLEARLAQAEAELDRLRAKAAEAEADARIETDKRIADARRKCQAAREELARLGAAGEGAFEDMKQGVERAWRDLEEAVSTAAKRFR